MAQTKHTPPVDTNVVVGALPGHKRRNLLLIAGVIIIVAGVAGGWKLWQIRTANTKKAKLAVAAIQAKSAGTVALQAEDLSYQNKYADAQKLVDASIAQTTDKVKLESLYETKATLAYNAKKYADSLRFALAAEKAYPTRNSANLAAMAAEALGNKLLAVEYYKKVLARTDTATQERTDYEYQELQDKIKQLGG